MTILNKDLDNFSPASMNSLSRCKLTCLSALNMTFLACPSLISWLYFYLTLSACLKAFLVSLASFYEATISPLSFLISPLFSWIVSLSFIRCSLRGWMWLVSSPPNPKIRDYLRGVLCNIDCCSWTNERCYKWGFGACCCWMFWPIFIYFYSIIFNIMKN